MLDVGYKFVVLLASVVANTLLFEATREPKKGFCYEVKCAQNRIGLLYILA